MLCFVHVHRFLLFQIILCHNVILQLWCHIRSNSTMLSCRLRVTGSHLALNILSGFHATSSTSSLPLCHMESVNHPEQLCAESFHKALKPLYWTIPKSLNVCHDSWWRNCRWSWSSRGSSYHIPRACSSGGSLPDRCCHSAGILGRDSQVSNMSDSVTPALLWFDWDT